MSEYRDWIRSIASQIWDRFPDPEAERAERSAAIWGAAIARREMFDTPRELDEAFLQAIEENIALDLMSPPADDEGQWEELPGPNSKEAEDV